MLVCPRRYMDPVPICDTRLTYISDGMRTMQQVVDTITHLLLIYTVTHNNILNSSMQHAITTISLMVRRQYSRYVCPEDSKGPGFKPGTTGR